MQISSCVCKAVRTIQTLGTNTVLLRIEAKGWCDADAFTKAARQEYIDRLPAAHMFSSKGPKVASSKFFSINKGWRAQRQELPTKAFVFAHMCNDKGWVKRWDELFEAHADTTASSTGGGRRWWQRQPRAGDHKRSWQLY